MHWRQVNSRLLVVGSQIASLTPENDIQNDNLRNLKLLYLNQLLQMIATRFWLIPLVDDSQHLQNWKRKKGKK
jgi:hypothetical protein